MTPPGVAEDGEPRSHTSILPHQTHQYHRTYENLNSLEPFSGWTKTFTDPRLCAAIVDRLTFAGQIIETGTTSYRLAHARQRRADGRDRK